MPFIHAIMLALAIVSGPKAKPDATPHVAPVTVTQPTEAATLQTTVDPYQTLPSDSVTFDGLGGQTGTGGRAEADRPHRDYDPRMISCGGSNPSPQA
jgi:hypothetical protein